MAEGREEREGGRRRQEMRGICCSNVFVSRAWSRVVLHQNFRSSRAFVFTETERGTLLSRTVFSFASKCRLNCPENYATFPLRRKPWIPDEWLAHGTTDRICHGCDICTIINYVDPLALSAFVLRRKQFHYENASGTFWALRLAFI